MTAAQVMSDAVMLACMRRSTYLPLSRRATSDSKDTRMATGLQPVVRDD
jgi:hypothetical protein